MRSQAYYSQAVTAIIWLMWPMCTYAASVTLGDSIGDVPLRSWLTVLVLAAVSGLVALLQRMNRAVQIEQEIERIKEWGEDDSPVRMKLLYGELFETEIPERWKLFIVYHMAGALMMGVISFLFLEASNPNDFLEAVFIALSSYGGARMMDKLGAKWVKRVLSSVKS